MRDKLKTALFLTVLLPIVLLVSGGGWFVSLADKIRGLKHESAVDNLDRFMTERLGCERIE